MASSVQFENTYPEDERWLDAGAEAFALHFAACCYTDRHNKDGLIPKAMASRVALAVPPDRVADSIQSLIETGFWTEEKTAYRITNYLEDKIGIPAEEKLANRARWAADKKWRRKHNAGNHSECPPEKCRQSGVVSHVDSHGSPTRSPSRVREDSSRTTRLDTTRLDSTPGGGSESESEGRPSGPASARATASRRSAGKATVRRFQGVDVTPAMIGGQDPNALDEFQLESLLVDHFYPDVGVDPAAESLDGLVAAGGPGA